MAIQHWHPSEKISKYEEILLKSVRRTKKLFGFLRRHRREIFNDKFQDELAGMYRDTGAGSEPVTPALMAMATLLQGYVGSSDAETVQLTVVDLRWQLVLGCLGAEETAFSQGAFQSFRDRMIEHDMDRRILERTAEVARQTKEFDWKKLPKDLRVAIDSSPLEGAGRVEDTFNLLGHAASKVVNCAAAMLGWKPDQVAKKAGIPVLLATSVKAGLDIEWSDPDAKVEALDTLVNQLDSLEAWLSKKLPEEVNRPPLRDHVDTLKQIRSQDLEPDPSGGGTRIRKGVAPDRRVSIEDKEMRHGRKSKTKRFSGYKRHLATDLDTDLVLACAITPANAPEGDAAPGLKADIDRQKKQLSELHIDRAYINSPVVQDVRGNKGEVICKPWVPRNGELFTKTNFKINIRDLTITCPAGETESIQPGSTVEFDPETCDRCELRAQCTMAAPGNGRSVRILGDEQLQQRLRKQISTPRGRARLRERVAVEHSLAHLGRRQGRRARYCGTRKNLYDTRRNAAIQNLENIHRRLLAPKLGAA